MNNSIDKLHEIGVAGFMAIALLAGSLFGLGEALVEHFTFKPIEVRYTIDVRGCDPSKPCKITEFTFTEPLTQKMTTVNPTNTHSE